MLVDFFCFVFSLSAFMHALMSSACPISSILSLALQVVCVFFFSYCCPDYFGGIHLATFFSLVLPNFILYPAFLLKTGADSSLVPLFLSSIQKPLSSCIQSTMSSFGICFPLSPAQSPTWTTMCVLRLSDPVSPGAFEHSTSVELRLPMLLQHLVSITTLCCALHCYPPSHIHPQPCHCSHFLPCPFSHLCKSY